MKARKTRRKTSFVPRAVFLTITAASVVPMCVTSCQAGTAAGDSGTVAQGVARTGFEGGAQGVANVGFDANGLGVAQNGFDGTFSVANTGFDGALGVAQTGFDGSADDGGDEAG